MNNAKEGRMRESLTDQSSTSLRRLKTALGLQPEDGRIITDDVIENVRSRYFSHSNKCLFLPHWSARSALPPPFGPPWFTDVDFEAP